MPFPAVSSYRDLIHRIVNVLLCLLGLTVGFDYLTKGLMLGWLFLAVFLFFLFAQFASPTDYDI
ncbi:hypothetical protein [Larkinella arboricola]|nr:hypothetical protein [Larkinella arboricola]